MYNFALYYRLSHYKGDQLRLAMENKAGDTICP